MSKPEGLILTMGGSRPLGQLTFRWMSVEEILALRPRDRVWFLADDGTARLVTINGRVKTWKRDPDRFEVPVKYGLYETARWDRSEALVRFLVNLD